jgi:hypothetical protein
MMLRRHPGVLMVAIAVCLVFVSAAVLFLHRQAQQVALDSGGGDGPGWHTAHAAFGLSDSRFAIEISGVDRDAHPDGAPAPPKGYHYVTFGVDFTNRGTNQQRANPNDFALIAGGGTRVPTFVASTACAQWPMADLHPAGEAGTPPRDPGAQQVGPNLGPRTLCFLAGGAPDEAMTLVWNPDVSIAFLGDPTTIRIS